MGILNCLLEKRSATIFLLTLLLSTACQKKQSFFESIDSEDSGIAFANTLQYSDSLSVLEFEYMYNGAGVAVADFDNDGLQDIYFLGNMTSNRLYKNLGGWKFEDLTEEAGVGTTHWSNGVAVVDINQDGYQDIYVCRGGPRGSKASERTNLLFINQTAEKGSLSFEEKAASWGLADIGYNVQSTFFDYDQDGDLDVYVLSNDLVDFNRNVSRPKDRSGKAPSVDKLFRNNGDETFTDVSADAGILIEGFGLGVEVCDINTDGWPDIYVSNDFLTDDLLYVNQKDGTFLNQNSTYFKHLTYNGMGNDIGDINNDGHMDVVVLDMLPPDSKRWKLTMAGNRYDVFDKSIKDGYQPQYIRNTLQLNNGNGSFSEVGQIAGISATEWSWSALLFDYDHDGLKDLCITNGYRQDITNLDFMVYGNQVMAMGTEEANRKDRIAALNDLPGIKKRNFLYKNQGDFTFDDISKDAGFINATYSNGMAYADFDNDGDLDLVMNNIDEPASLFRNNTDSEKEARYIKFKFEGNTPNRDGIGSQVAIYYQGNLQKQYFTPFRGYLSTVEKSVHFGLGSTNEIDKVVVTWPDGKVQQLEKVATNQEIILRHSEARTATIPAPASKQNTLFQSLDSTGLEVTHVENSFVDYKVQPLLPHMHSRNGPGLAVADVNADGLEDVYVGGAKGQAAHLLLQQADGSFEKHPFPDTESEDMGTLFFDADNDGDTDLFVVSGGSAEAMGNSTYQDRLYENDGNGSFKRTQALPRSLISGSVVTASDYDKDGDLDLFVGGRVRPGDYPMPPSSILLNNISTKGSIQFENDAQEINQTFKTLGMVTDALWTDFNNDTWQDLIVVGEFMQIRIFENRKGILTEITDSTGLQNTGGWWNSITGGDFDNDGDIDYVLGNLGLNSRYKASPTEPLCIYASDYDKNGQIDPIMCYYIEGENHVAHSRSDLIDQINAMRARFRTYSDYAESSFEESFLKEEIAAAHVVKSETFANSYMENLGNGKFRLSELPRKAQIAPMYGMLVNDYTGDGYLDLLSVGNFYSGEVFSGRYDASIGWLLEGDGKGGFKTIDVAESGFYVEGDAKGMVQLIVGDQQLTLIGVNNAPLRVFTKAIENRVYQAKTTDRSALIQYEDGSAQKVEFYFGGSYLSHSSRSLRIPSNAVSILVSDNKGRQTEMLPPP